MYFRYKGRDIDGNIQKGTIEATHYQDAVRRLRKREIHPREIVEMNSILYKEITIGSAVKQAEFVAFCRQFATLIRAGVSIVDAIDILAKQTINKVFRKTLLAIGDDLQSGIAFSAAVEKKPKIFPAIFVSMIKVGETTGNLDQSLERLATHFEKNYTLKKKVQSTMTYPIVLLALIIFVAIFLLTWVVPKFVQSFANYGATLPSTTQFIITVSDFVKAEWWFILLIFIICLMTSIVFYKKNEKFQYTVCYILLKMPVFGPLIQKVAIARMTRTLSTMIRSSVPILIALTVTEKVVGNKIIEKVMQELKASLEVGSSMTAALKDSWVIPPFVTQMIHTGEKTGSLDFMLEKTATFYEEEVDRVVDTLKSLIEPIMILLLACLVGFIVIAIMLPMFSLYEQM